MPLYTTKYGKYFAENERIAKEWESKQDQQNKIQQIESAIDIYIDNVAAQRNYGTATMSPTAACIAYVGYANPYQAEALAFATWKASIWPIVFQIMDDCVNGLRAEPTAEEIIEELPKLVWP